MILTHEDLKQHIRDIPDFPKKGIIFKDITTLLSNKEAFKSVVDIFAQQYENANIDYIVGIEARGFIFAPVLAYRLNAGFVPVRKKGKLPYKTQQVTYDLEYGTDTLEMHEDAIKPGSRVLIVDDLLATGGTCAAVVKMLKDKKVEIAGVAFLVELAFLNGKELLKDLDIFSIIKY